LCKVHTDISIKQKKTESVRRATSFSLVEYTWHKEIDVSTSSEHVLYFRDK